MSQPDIFVGVPVYQGQEFVAETLRSIRDQTYPHFRALISVDGNDETSAAVCRPFLSDPRFTMVVQPDRLGWQGNLNYLLNRCDRPFFCYWQQDDLTVTNYLAELRAALLVDPTVSIAFADIQWFGASFHREAVPSVLGTPTQRVLEVLQYLRYEPLRGLMRADKLWRPNPLPSTPEEGCCAEYAFLGQMAVCGGFHRVASTLYFKRHHADNTFVRWFNWPVHRRRAAWVRMGVLLFQIAADTLPRGSHRDYLQALVLDRLTVQRPGRNFAYQGDESRAEIDRMARDFFSMANTSPALADTDPGTFAPVIHPTVRAVIKAERLGQEWRSQAASILRQGGSLDWAMSPDDPAMALLGHGWSLPEPWGVWSDGPTASLRLPPAGPGSWQITLEGKHFARGVWEPDQRVRILWRVGSRAAFQTAEISAGGIVRLDLPCDDLGTEATRLLELQFPDGVPLADEGIPDARHVALGLHRIGLARR